MFFSDVKFINSKRQSANLKHLLTITKFTNTDSQEFKVSPCGESRCKCCKEITTGSTFFFKNVNKEFHIKYNFNCNTRNLIYVLSCNNCEEYYIGETE